MTYNVIRRRLSIYIVMFRPTPLRPSTNTFFPIAIWRLILSFKIMKLLDWQPERVQEEICQEEAAGKRLGGHLQKEATLGTPVTSNG